MLNHKTIFKQKSKILLTIICIFGLAFSYSCSCRNPNKPPSGGGNFEPKANPSSKLSLIASEDGTTKTQVAISFYEENSHNIKSAKVTKIVDTNGNDITDKATYVFSDGKFSFIKQSDLKDILTGMDSTSAPVTNTLTVTFEITTDSTEVLNTTATVDVNVYLVKTQKFDNQATILKGIMGSLDRQLPTKFVQFEFTSDKAGLTSIDLQDTLHRTTDEALKSEHPAATFVSDMLRDIKNLENYTKYFDNVATSEEPTGIGTGILTIRLAFTPKNLYDMELVDYTIKLDCGNVGKWISGK